MAAISRTKQLIHEARTTSPPTRSQWQRYSKTWIDRLSFQTFPLYLLYSHRAVISSTDFLLRSSACLHRLSEFWLFHGVLFFSKNIFLFHIFFYFFFIFLPGYLFFLRFISFPWRLSIYCDEKKGIERKVRTKASSPRSSTVHLVYRQTFTDALDNGSRITGRLLASTSVIHE